MKQQSFTTPTPSKNRVILLCLCILKRGTYAYIIYRFIITLNPKIFRNHFPEPFHLIFL